MLTIVRRVGRQEGGGGGGHGARARGGLDAEEALGVPRLHVPARTVLLLRSVAFCAQRLAANR